MTWIFISIVTTAWAIIATLSWWCAGTEHFESLIRNAHLQSRIEDLAERLDERDHECERCKYHHNQY